MPKAKTADIAQNIRCRVPVISDTSHLSAMHLFADDYIDTEKPAVRPLPRIAYPIVERASNGHGNASDNSNIHGALTTHRRVSIDSAGKAIILKGCV